MPKELTVDSKKIVSRLQHHWRKTKFFYQPAWVNFCHQLQCCYYDYIFKLHDHDIICLPLSKVLSCWSHLKGWGGLLSLLRFPDLKTVFDRRPKNQIKKENKLKFFSPALRRGILDCRGGWGTFDHIVKTTQEGWKFEFFLGRYFLAGGALWKLLTADFNW